MKKLTIALLLILSPNLFAASQMNKGQAQVVGAYMGGYVGAAVGVISGALIGYSAGEAKGAGIGAAVGLLGGAALGVLTGVLVAGSGYPDEDEEARLDFNRRFVASLR